MRFGAANAGNYIAANAYGVMVTDPGSTGNTIAYNTVVQSDSGGMFFSVASHDNTIGPQNHIAHSGADGVLIDGAATVRIVVTQNSIVANGDRGIELGNTANGGIPEPTIAGVALVDGAVNIVGQACPGCTAEVFASHDADGEGEMYVGSAIADGGGQFLLVTTALPAPNLTATASDVGARHVRIFSGFRLTAAVHLSAVDCQRRVMDRAEGASQAEAIFWRRSLSPDFVRTDMLGARHRCRRRCSL